MPACFFGVGFGTHKSEDHVGFVGAACPDFLAVDQEVVSVFDGRGLEAGEIAS